MNPAWQRRALGALVAGALLAGAEANAQAPQACRLHRVYLGAMLDFGTIDPSRGGEVGLTRGGMQMTGHCAPGSQIQVLSAPGLVLTGPSGARLPYTVDARLEPGGNGHILRLSLSIPRGSYNDLPAGEYEGHFTVSVMP